MLGDARAWAGSQAAERKLQELAKPGALVVSFVLRAEPGTPSVAFERRSADFSNQLTIQPKPSHSRPSSGARQKRLQTW
ncbi:hypothetical protein CN200_04000 [Sinorhizobium meliloti]|nr:hypothetical protein CN215_13100 [Sinorhizobium meliloti]RVI19289.1 hypothetical protein CN200_04000 [Sinorhizobium meliloti]RVK26545.1 hypothetical protein CN161_30450 [Sinorhizobium meliloti]RVO35803.1 hypothetical protein CN093_23210 [Sinorhizobium meliloti]RVO89006.1 hypothetical protein CN089_28540 [Sinorhizobium meliloti]